MPETGPAPPPIFEEEGESHRLAVYLSEDKMEAYLVLQKTGEPMHLSPEALAEKLRQAGVTAGVDTDRIGLAVREAVKADGEKSPPVLVARGVEPEDGQDGQIEHYVQPSSEEVRYERAPDGSIDYHSTHLIENVHEGQEVARVLPPRPAVAGHTVTGETLGARDGEPARARAGKGVRAEADGEVFVAEMAGRLVVEEDTLSISQTYEIKGSVDYSTGDVDFVGHVIVSGDVQDEFKVTAGMGLEVRGTIGACTIEVNGPLAVGGGVAGKTKADLQVEGPVRAKYINEAKLEASGDVTVEREAYNSNIATAGKFLCEQGRVIGGEVTALKGVVVGTAGSEMGVATRICVGVDYRRTRRLRSAAAELAGVDREITRISGKIGPLLAAPGRLASLPTKQKVVIKQLLTQVRTLKEKRLRIGNVREFVDQEIEASAVRQVNVLKQVFPGVTVEIGDARGVIRSVVNGPLSLLENVDGTTYEAPLAELKAGRVPGELAAPSAPPAGPEEEASEGEEPAGEAPSPEPPPEGTGAEGAEEE